VLAIVLLVAAVDRAPGQTFGLDDCPVAPLIGPPGFGMGAEDEYGFVGPPLAPSPSLSFLGPNGDGAWLSPGPFIQHPNPNGFYVDAFSRHHVDTGVDITLDFSVDRVTFGVAGSAVGAEAAFGQAHGDIYTTTHTYFSPGLFVGLPPGPFAGWLPAISGGAPGNVLTFDDSFFGLLTSAGIVPPGVPVPPPIVTPGMHDNLESFDNIASFDPDGDGLFNFETYFTLAPDEAAPLGLSPADIFAVAVGDPGALTVPYAPFAFMGLDPFQDSIDALVMYDNNLKPIPIALPGAPGMIEPIIDYALFSLAPGSISLQIWGLDGADVLFTDFTGAFAVYAPTPSLDLLPLPPGLPFTGDNVDALDAVPTAPPPTITLVDGGCVYHLRNLVGERLTVNGGIADLTTGVNDHLFQNWFWYRGTGDTREYALSNQVYLSNSSNRARLIYREPIADGAIPDALLFDLEYTISDLSAAAGGAAPPACARCEIVIAIKIRNLTPDPVTLSFFSYNDMDLNGDAAGDSAVIAGVDNHIQLVFDPGPGGTNCISSGVYKVSSTDHVAWEIDSYAIIVNKLADAVADVLVNAVSPFGPGNYTGAQQWDITLGPAGSVDDEPFDEWVGSVVKEVTVYQPGDIDGDCDVDLTDLAALLSAYGTACTP
jgi:hypothetical protein